MSVNRKLELTCPKGHGTYGADTPDEECPSCADGAPEWDGSRCRVCGIKTKGDDLCNQHYEEAENNMGIIALPATSIAQQIKDILVSLATRDELPLDLNELDPGIFEPALAGAVFPSELKDRYVSLEVPVPGQDKIMANIRVKLDDEGVVVDAFQPQQDGDTGEHFQEPVASTWKTYQMMKDGEE